MKKNAESGEISIDTGGYDDTGEGTALDIPDAQSDPQKRMEDRDHIIRLISLLNRAVQMKMKAAQTKFCYTQRFYTEWITYLLHTDNILLRWLPAQTESRMDLAFANHYLQGQIAALSDVITAELKPLLAFTGKDSDTRPCGYSLHTVVYQTYIENVTEGKKRPNASAVSQQRTKFDEIVKDCNQKYLSE